MTGTPFSFRGRAEQRKSRGIHLWSSSSFSLRWTIAAYIFLGSAFLSVAFLLLGPNSLGPGHIENQSCAETRATD